MQLRRPCWTRDVRSLPQDAPLGQEKLLYEPGEELPVFETPLGRIGLLVCYDAWFPEAARTLAVKGAQILCIPSNAPDDWVPEAQRRGDLTMLDVHCIAAANANRVFVAAANRLGDGYLGRSCIVDVTGGVLALAGATEEGVIGAEVDLDRARGEKQLTDLSHAFEDRNPAVYERQDDRGVIYSISSSTSSSIAAAEVALKIRTLPRSG